MASLWAPHWHRYLLIFMGHHEKNWLQQYDVLQFISTVDMDFRHFKHVL